MKSYLQRLAARAEGIAATPAIAPAAIRYDRQPDPFEAVVDDGLPSQSTQRAGRKQTPPAIEPSSEAVSTPPASTFERSTPRRAARSMPMISPEPVGEDESNKPERKSARRPRKKASEEVAVLSPAEPRRIIQSERPDQPEFAAPQTQAREAVSAQDLSPLPAADRSIPSGKENDSQDEANRLDRLAQALIEQLAPRLPSGEKPPLSSMPAKIIERETPTLAPPAPAEPRPVDSTPDEPRLVIGRLRVDVLSAPPAAGEAAAVIVRAPAPSRNEGTARPVSKLRFGLGQM